MKSLLPHLVIFVSLGIGTPHLQAAWNFETLSNATEGSLASRVVLGGERTLIAYRSGNALVVASSTGGALVSETILANANPSNIFVSVGTRGAGLVSYWNGIRYRFALQVAAGSGNCGPSSNWFCASVALPAGVVGVLAEKIVGQADATLVTHFFYRVRTAAGGALDGIYYASRTPSGIWTVSANIHPFLLASQNPVAIEVVSANQISFMTAGAGSATVGRKTSNGISIALGNIPTSSETYGDMEKKYFPAKFCVSTDWGTGSGAPAGTADIRYTKRDPNTGIWLGDQTVLPALEYARHHCSIQVKAAGTPVVAYATDADVVRVWRFGVWETIDASGAFSKPILELTPADKLLILYQGAGFLKFGREQ